MAASGRRAHGAGPGRGPAGAAGAGLRRGRGGRPRPARVHRVVRVALGPGEAGSCSSGPGSPSCSRNTLALLLGVVAERHASSASAARGWWSAPTCPARSLWHVLFVAPLAVPAFVNSYGWVSLTHAVQTYPGAVLVVTLSYFPLVYLPTVAVLRTLDPALEEVALSLGRSPLGDLPAGGAARRRARPCSAARSWSGCTCSPSSAPCRCCASRRSPPRSTTSTAPRSTAPRRTCSPACWCCSACCCSSPSCGCAATPGWRASAPARPARAERVRLGRLTAAALAGVLALVALRGRRPGLQPGALARRRVLDGLPARRAGRGDRPRRSRSALGCRRGGHRAGAARRLARRPAPRGGRRCPGAVHVTAHALPGIVVALALVAVSIRMVRPLYQTVPLLLLGYAMLFLPRALVSVRSSLEHAPPVLDDVARSLGLRPGRRARPGDAAARPRPGSAPVRRWCSWPCRPS